MIVGAGRHRRPVRALIRDLGLTTSVRLLPPVPRAELAAFHRAAGVLAFASGTDTQSLVVAEAEAAGLPVVLADPALGERPGTPSRRCTCAATPEALAAALLRMLDDPALRERTRRAGLDAAAAYPPARHLALLTAAYGEAVRRGPAGSGDEVPDQHDGQEDHDERQVDADAAEA